MKRSAHIWLIAALLAVTACSQRLEGLEVDFQPGPQTIGCTETLFSWSFGADGFVQDKCRVVIKDVWDSGEVNSVRGMMYLPPDVRLESFRRYVWKVESWDRDGKKRTGKSSFKTAVFPEGNWLGRWITGDSSERAQTEFRKVFSVGKGLRSAILCISSTDAHIVRIGGKAPNGEYAYHTQLYDGIALSYRIHDVTSLLGKGDNTISARVSGTPPALLAEIHLFYKDGSHDIVGTGDEWETVRGAGADSLAADRAVIIPAPCKLLFPDGAAPSVRVKVQPEDTRQGDTLKMFDFPSLVRGGCAVEAVGKAGTQVRLRYYHPDGRTVGYDVLALEKKGRTKWTDYFSVREFQTVEARFPAGTRVRLYANSLGAERPSSWMRLRGVVEGFMADPAPSGLPLRQIDTLYSKMGDWRVLEAVWPRIEQYLSHLGKKDPWPDEVLLNKFAIALGKDPAQYREPKNKESKRKK